MDVREMPDIDVRIKLLSGSPFIVENVGEVHPLKLLDIASMGVSKYNQYLHLLTLTLEDLGVDPKEFGEENIKPFDVFLSIGEESPLGQIFFDALRVMLKQEIKVLSKLGLIIVGEINENSLMENKILDRDNYDQLKAVLQLQNCLKTQKDVTTVSPADEKVRAILEKLKKGKEVIEKAKSKSTDEESSIDIVDIISAVTAKSQNIDKFNVWSLTLYQLYDEYKRLEVISSYDITIQSLLHGADSKKLDIKHWSSKIRD